MTSAELLTDAFGRIRQNVYNAVGGMDAGQLAFRVDPGANSIAWLVWHLSRVQDDHIADAAGVQQAWTAAGWAKRFNLPFDDAATGYGHGQDDVAAVQVDSAELLTGYHDAVHEMTIRYVRTLTDADLPRVIDSSWNPPVTLAVRLVSVVDDCIQHAGQAAFVHGIIDRS